VSFLFGAGEHGAESLARCRPGDSVALQGPVGRGFAVSPGSRNLLLVGQGTDAAPLAALAEWAVGAGNAVTLLAGAETSSGLLPPAMLPAEVEYRVATSGGSLGHHGPVLDLLRPAGEVPLLLWADQVFASGPAGLYAGLRDAIGVTRTRREPGFAQGMAKGYLGCGAGACLGCAIDTRDGTVYLCKAGPVVDLERLLL
jgi:dihydroorotate dehydrogenase electron transfer subunit